MILPPSKSTLLAAVALAGLVLVILSFSACSSNEPVERREVYVDGSQWRGTDQQEPDRVESVRDQKAKSSVYFDQAMQSMASQIADSMSAEGKTKVAILDYVSISNKTPGFVGPFISEQLISLLFLTGRFEVIERRFLDTVLAEQDLSVSDLFDDASIKKLGCLLGVDAILVGTYTDMGVELCVNGRLISVESGQVFAVAMEQIKKDERIAALMDAGTEDSGKDRAEREKIAVEEDTSPNDADRDRPDPMEKYNRVDRSEQFAGESSPPFKGRDQFRGRKGTGNRPPLGQKTTSGARPGDPPFRPGILTVRALCFQNKIGEAGDLARDLLEHPKFDKEAQSLDWGWISYTLTEEAFIEGKNNLPIEKEAYERPLQFAKRALRCDPNDPVALSAMGQVLFRLGRQREAMHHFDLVLQQNPKNEDLPPQVKRILPKVARNRPSKKTKLRPSD